jgi:hypothetical protein
MAISAAEANGGNGKRGWTIGKSRHGVGETHDATNVCAGRVAQTEAEWGIPIIVDFVVRLFPLDRVGQHA